MTNISLNCIFTDRLTVDPVTISSTGTVAELKNAIKAVTRCNASKTDFMLWRVSIPLAATQEQMDAVFIGLSDGNSISSSQTIQSLFPEVPVQGAIHIVVKWQALLSEQEFARLRLSDIVYNNPEAPGSRLDSTRKHALAPRTVRAWRTFFSSVRGMQLSNQPLYAHPTFSPSRLISNEGDLYGIFRVDIGSVEVLPPFATTNASGVFLHGTPDLSCSSVAADGTPRVLFPIEIKTAGVLHLADGVSLERAYHQQRSRSRGPVRPLRQIYGYMKLNGYRYGVLSTYTQTWFLRIDGNQDDELCVSPTISVNSTAPSVQECYLWLIRTAPTDGVMRIPSAVAATALRAEEGTRNAIDVVKRAAGRILPH